MRRLLLMAALAAFTLAAAPALAQDPPLDLSMTYDLYCDTPDTTGMIGSGFNVAMVGNLCGGLVVTGGTANAYGVNLLTPTQLTVNVVSPAVQVTILSGPPYTANSCVTYSLLAANPTVTACLPAGYYSILLSSPLSMITPFELGLSCAPCVPVGDEARSWGSLKGSYR